MAETPIVRAVFGAVTHADGTMTTGLHVRNADGVLECVAPTAETMDWQQWGWAWHEAQGRHRRGWQRDDTCHDAH